MIEVSAVEFARRLDHYRDLSHREPVGIRGRAGVSEVLVSKPDFDNFQKLKSQEARGYLASELPAI